MFTLICCLAPLFASVCCLLHSQIQLQSSLHFIVSGCFQLVILSAPPHQIDQQISRQCFEYNTIYVLFNWHRGYIVLGPETDQTHSSLGPRMDFRFGPYNSPQSSVCSLQFREVGVLNEVDTVGHKSEYKPCHKNS